MKNNKLEEIRIIFQETKDVFNRNLENIDKIDSKIVQLFTFVTALILLLINFIPFPIYYEGKFLYLLAVICFVLSLGLLFGAYMPKKYFALDCNSLINEYNANRYKNAEELTKAICGRIAEDTISLKKNKTHKSNLFIWAAVLSVVGVILIIGLKIIGVK